MNNVWGYIIHVGIRYSLLPGLRLHSRPLTSVMRIRASNMDAMPLYALATVPLIHRLDNVEDLRQVWYADDASATGLGSLVSIRSWWDQLSTVGPAFGYHANAPKTWLVTKEQCFERAKEMFLDTDVNVTCEGRPYLGTPLGTCEYTEQYIKERVSCWIGDLQLLADIAKSQPHAAYSAFTHGFSHKFSYLCRTTPDIAPHLVPLEDFLRTTFIPALTGRAPPDDTVRDLFALPTRLGGLAIVQVTLQSPVNKIIWAPQWSQGLWLL